MCFLDGAFKGPGFGMWSFQGLKRAGVAGNEMGEETLTVVPGMETRVDLVETLPERH